MSVRILIGDVREKLAELPADHFGGAGTTALVADRLGRDCTLIELNADYAEIADRRLRAGLCRVDSPAAPVNAGPLFGSAG